MRNTPTGVGKTYRRHIHHSQHRKHPHGRGEDDRPKLGKDRRIETPPRAWGRRGCGAAVGLVKRNTPTGVGKTKAIEAHVGKSWKHPHGRGEDLNADLLALKRVETPPRAWGRRPGDAMERSYRRNTPTGVGKTAAPIAQACCARKHPHGRGEDRVTEVPFGGAAETPPRAWGRLHFHLVRAGEYGNTPTGVGKTDKRLWGPTDKRKHPHGRGEDYAPKTGRWPSIETPPRAWGRLHGKGQQPFEYGNTPTGVGKTHTPGFPSRVSRKHPHGRGEDCSAARQAPVPWETPPRAWGRLIACPDRGGSMRNTPTGVGKTGTRHGLPCRNWKHPHGRGEDYYGPMWVLLG